MKPARLAFARSFGMVWAEVSPECGFPTATSQFQPASRGSPMTWARLAPNTSAAMTAASASAVPSTAERTGTGVRSLARLEREADAGHGGGRESPAGQPARQT